MGVCFGKIARIQMESIVYRHGNDCIEKMAGASSAREKLNEGHVLL